MSMSSGLTRKRKHSDASVANHRQRVNPSAAILPPTQTRDDECATEIAHSSTIQVDNCTAQDQARVQYGHTYVQNQYNHHGQGPQHHSGNIKQRMDFIKALAFDEMDSRYESIDPAHINTCQWLFQKSKYLQWRDPEYLKLHNGFLWIKGKAGSGKSTLMKCAFEHAKTHFRNEKIISFFFNARGQHLEKSVEGMYRSLISQILRQFPRLRPKFPTHVPDSVQQQGWAIPALRNHLHRAITNLGQDDAITLYIDALDECDEDDIREAIERFEELGSAALSMPISLRICFASRYYPRVSIQRCIEIHVEEQIEHQQDIRNYINSKLIIRNVTFRAQLASEIEARASGVFFWVVLVVRLINRRCDGGASHSEISTCLQEVPGKLQELIGAVLHSPGDALLCTLRWILFAGRPLKLEELYFAIRTGIGELTPGIWDTSEVDREDMKAFMLTSSRGLVEIKSYERGGTRAQLVHESVREYLITGCLKELGPCSDKMVAANNHAELFQWCQSYLGSIKQEHVATTEDRDDRSLYHVRKTYPLHEYAGFHILYHFEIAYIAGVFRLSDLHEFPTWQCIYSLKSEIGPRMYKQLLEPHRLFTSLLYVVVRIGCAHLAEALLAENAVNTSQLNYRGCTSATASNRGLPAPKIDLNLHFEGSCSSLLELAVAQCPRVVHTLLDHGADVTVGGGAPLCMAVTIGSNIPGMEDIARLLLARGAHAQVCQGSGSREMTALALAVRTRSLAIVTLLLDHGADANGAIGTPGVSPLLAAIGHMVPRKGGWYIESRPVNRGIVRALLDHGADVNLRAGPERISPLQFATDRRESKILVPLLESYGQRHIGGAHPPLDPATKGMIEEVEQTQ
jgi:hypothetical protein